MKFIQGLAGATLALLLAAGCSAADDGHVDGVEADTAQPQAETSASTELARVEFDDGRVVRFEELAGGILISDFGPSTSTPRLVPQAGMKALDAFKAVAPGRAVPAALLQMHERMYPAGATVVPEANTGEVFEAEEPSFDEDAEHNGEFQQSLPSSNFSSRFCNFPTGNGLNYKHMNRTDVHTDTSMGIHTAYYAIGADIGTITLQACAGKNAGGYFSGICAPTAAVYNEGYGGSTYYDAGIACPGDPNLLCRIFGCPKICTPRKVRFELHHGKISSNVRFHECASFTP